LAKHRVDILLARRGLAESREKAKILVMAGSVYLNGDRVTGADRIVEEDAQLEVRSNPLPYVGFGGIKLEHAIAYFGVDVRGKTAVDIGSSTGGFVDYLLKTGVSRVYAVDVGTHQLHERLRADERVVVLENVNARYLSPNAIGEPVDLATVDVSFISLKKIIPSVIPLLTPNGILVTLVKPQFEVGRYQVGKGGIVKDEERIRVVLDEIKAFGVQLGLRFVDITEAPRDRDRKNREYFILWER
jgi:23S rRNA (cytidine1920-2'-O)/16S rRNA (cytidine1409-2'-O)-methyltransferase